MSTQPEALRLASELFALGYGGTCSLAAAELRRLHTLNQELLEALKCADAMLSGANIHVNVVQYKVRAAIAKATGENT